MNCQEKANTRREIHAMQSMTASAGIDPCFASWGRRQLQAAPGSSEKLMHGCQAARTTPSGGFHPWRGRYGTIACLTNRHETCGLWRRRAAAECSSTASTKLLLRLCGQGTRKAALPLRPFCYHENGEYGPAIPASRLSSGQNCLITKLLSFFHRKSATRAEVAAALCLTPRH